MIRRAQLSVLSVAAAILAAMACSGSGAPPTSSPAKPAATATANVPPSPTAVQPSPIAAESIRAPVFVAKWGSEGSGDGQFNQPYSVAVDGQGNVYVAEAGNDRIQKFSGDRRFITKWGSEGSGDGQFDDPSGVAVDGQGNVYVADYENTRIQKFSGR